MTTGTALIAVAVLLFLNAFFVLAEFAMVKLRPTRVEALVQEGKPRAALVAHIQAHLDEYLSVCQLGITLASIGLGFVGEPAFAGMLEPLFGSWLWAHVAALALAYVLVSFLHILFGELVPKSLAIRVPELSALGIARPLQATRVLLWVPLVVLNGAANAVLRLIGFGSPVSEPLHTEQELRVILELSQTEGSLSFRQLLLMENVFDLRSVRVGEAMRLRDGVAVLRVDASWPENFAVIRERRQTRYPLVDTNGKPIGIVHVKDLALAGVDADDRPDLQRMARPFPTVRDDTSLETLLGDLQRRHSHMALVVDASDRWIGLITLEDIIEEIVGTIEDEFQLEAPLFLADGLTPGRVVLGLRAPSLEAAVREALARVPAAELPLPAARIADAVVERERGMPTLLARGLAAPHARMAEINQFVLVFARSEEGIPVAGRESRANLLFIMVTPARDPRIQLRLLARIAGLLDSDYVVERLRAAESQAQVVEVLRAADPGALD
jgi:CBS domain containing-hemolysin-like protein/mannitol/fructose-specific phosphotransferase system IIA component (Ntr-type)